LVAGVLLLSLREGATALERRTVIFALITGLTISAYTIIDGLGARASGHAWSYVTWLFVMQGLAFFVLGVVWFGRDLLNATSDKRSVALMTLSGAMSMTAYGIALWAMTMAPIALVGALRETSVLFAAIIGVVLLKERLIPSRVVAAALVVFGLGLLRFGA
jgi:drug/metabolite transporter (DMT)-like permease